MGAPLVHRLRVRYHECDRQGVVFNANYLAYFDVTITELMRAAFGADDAMVARGVDIVVAEAKLRYLSSARFDDEIDVVLTIVRIGETSSTFRFEVRRGSELLVDGETRHVFVDAESMRKTSIPAWAREGLAAWVVDAVGVER